MVICENVDNYFCLLWCQTWDEFPRLLTFSGILSYPQSPRTLLHLRAYETSPILSIAQSGKNDELFWDSIWLRLYYIWFCTILISVLAGLATKPSIIIQHYLNVAKGARFISFPVFLFFPDELHPLLLNSAGQQVGH